jgi:hypothetical protein
MGFARIPHPSNNADIAVIREHGGDDIEPV